MERLVIHFDSEDLISSVRASWQEAAGPMAAHFLCAYQDLYPRHLRALYTPSRSPVHSQLVTVAARQGHPTRARSEGRDAIIRSATQILEPCILALRKRLDGAVGRERRLLLVALSRFHHGTVESFLVDRMSDDAEGPLAAFLLTACFGEMDDQKLLSRVNAVWTTEVLPQFILSLRYLATDETLACLKRAARHRSPAVQWLTASCLDHFSRFDIRPAIDSIFAGQFGWAVAHAIESLGRMPQLSGTTPLVLQALEKFEHPLVRATAIRSLAAIGAPEALDVCVREIETSQSPHPVAQAIGSLIRLGAPPELRARLLVPRIKSQNLEVTTQAILGLIGADNQKAGRAVRDMIVEGGEDERVQAAYCLGYYPGESSLRVLEHLVRTDPSPAVRLQALRSFSYYSKTPQLLERLNGMLELDDERLVMDAIRILAMPSNIEENSVPEGILGVARYGASGPVRRLAMRALGRFDARLARAFIEETLANRDADPDALLGAVEASGWMDPPAPELAPLSRLLTHPVAAVRAAAARVLFSWGNPEGLPVLATMLGGNPGEARESIRALEEIATIIDFLLAEPRFNALAETLRGNLRNPGYLDFSRRELGLMSQPVELMDAVDPHEAVLSQRLKSASDASSLTAGHLLADIEAAQRKYPRERTARRARSVTQENPPVPGPEDRLSSGRPWPAWLPYVAAGCAGFILLVGLVVFGRGGREEVGPVGPAAPSLSAPLSQSLAVASVKGTAWVEKPGGGGREPLTTGRQVEPGQRVLAEKDSSVRLSTSPPGNTLLLQGEGSFTFDGVEIESQERRTLLLRVSAIQGQLIFDLKWGRPRVQVGLEGFQVRGWKGLYAIQFAKGVGAVKVVSGRVETTDRQGQFSLVTEGRLYSFKAGAERGEMGPYDPAQESWR